MSSDRAAPAVTAATRNTMRANRGRDTGPELRVRRRLHGAGLRYRVGTPLPFDRRRRADVYFSRVGLYVFIDGCFWHGCSTHFQLPKTNSAFWADKIGLNRLRDADTNERVRALGFISLRFWEHESAADVVDEIIRVYAELLADASPRSLRE